MADSRLSHACESNRSHRAARAGAAGCEPGSGRPAVRRPAKSDQILQEESFVAISDASGCGWLSPRLISLVGPGCPSFQRTASSDLETVRHKMRLDSFHSPV